MRLTRIPLLIESAPIGTTTPREPRSRKMTQRDDAINYDPEQHLISVKLDAPSKQRLIDKLGGHHPNINADHVTLHPPGKELSLGELGRVRKVLGKQVTFHATHHAADDGVQAVRVRGLDHLSAKPHKHVTISTNHGVSAKSSNDLLADQQGERLRDWIPLSGTVELSDRLGRA